MENRHQERGRGAVDDVMVAILNKVVREGVPEKIALEQGPRGEAAVSHADIWEQRWGRGDWSPKAQGGSLLALGGHSNVTWRGT